MISAKPLLFSIALLLPSLPSASHADPVQGGVLGGAAGAAIGGRAGLVTGAVLGGVGGAKAEEAERQKLERRKKHFEQREKLLYPETDSAQTDSSVEPLPTGSALIKQIQRSLGALGYLAGKADGLVDGPTVDAIRHYQEDHALMVSGKPSQQLLVHLRERSAGAALAR